MVYLFSAILNLALRARGFSLSSSSPAVIGRLPISFALGVLPHTHREIRRAGAAFRPVCVGAFHQPVLQRVKGNDRQPPPGIQRVQRCRQHPFHLAQFIVNRDADRLEGSLCGVLLFPPRFCRHRPPDQLRQLSRGLDGGLSPPPCDGGGDRTRIALLTVLPQDAS